MARTHARIYAAIWQDPDFIALPTEAQRVYVLALSQPGVSFCGVVSYTARRWASMAPDSTPGSIDDAVKHLEHAGFVAVDRDTEELLICSFAKHDGIMDSPNLVKAMWKAYPGIFSAELRRAFLLNLPDVAWETVPEGIEKPSPNPSPKVPEGDAQLPIPVPTPVPTPTPAPLALAVRSRDLLWDAAIECYDIDEGELNKNERGRINVALGLLRQSGAEPEEIPFRRRNYRLRFPDAADTLIALANRWAECRTPPGPRENGKNPLGAIGAIAREHA